MSQKILVVEDDYEILNLLKDVLEREGYEVTALNYTESIIKSVTQHNPDLVMLDFLLAGINGGELCHEIKANPGTALLQVIMLSAFPRVLDSLGNYGSDAFIAKPFDIAVVLKKVKECLEDRMAHA
ncbi:response regulator [Mucilaginibacter flavidus]|uniref:response regulator n=1 Tax=Mucilaginibacter flavidus TaxID=2949309 RepID=UPI0020922B68|nr:response regulator [Mucilaginibacter flavidus]MCO5947102.1 response regulator [Mucilaginibacter flavidus]